MCRAYLHVPVFQGTTFCQHRTGAREEKEGISARFSHNSTELAPKRYEELFAFMSGASATKERVEPHCGLKD